MSVYNHRVDNMAEGSAGMTRVVCARKQNDLPERICYTPNMLRCDTDIWLITLLLASGGCARPDQKSTVV